MTETTESFRPALYYPYIHIRSEDWLKATLLCVPVVKRLIPENYDPEDIGDIAPYAKIYKSERVQIDLCVRNGRPDSALEPPGAVCSGVSAARARGLNNSCLVKAGRKEQCQEAHRPNCASAWAKASAPTRRHPHGRGIGFGLARMPGITGPSETCIEPRD
jgi:hypothetical protein